ncbi:MAG: hypothetical protein ABW190_17480 [Rhizobacter sp.]
MLIVLLLALVAGGLASAGLWLLDVWRAVPARNQDFELAEV